MAIKQVLPNFMIIIQLRNDKELLEFLWQEKVLFCWKICGKLESAV